MKYNRIISTVLKFAFTIGVIYYLIKTGILNFQRLSLFIESPEILFIILTALFLFVVPLNALRWWLLLKALTIKIPLGRAYLLTWIGNFFNATLPGAVTGDLIKGYYTVKSDHGNNKTSALTTLVIDRVTGLFGLIIMAFFALLYNWALIFSQVALRPLAIFIFILFMGVVIFYTIILFPFAEDKDPFINLLNRLPKSDFFLKIYGTFKKYQFHWKTLGVTLLISLCIHCIVAFLFLLIARMMGMNDLNLATQMFVMPIGLITMSIPVSPGGIGIGHAAFEALYLLIGIKGGADIFNLFIVLQLAVYLLGGIVYFGYSSEYRKSQKNN